MRSYSATCSVSVGVASSCASSTSRYFSDCPVFSYRRSSARSAGRLWASVLDDVLEGGDCLTGVHDHLVPQPPDLEFDPRLLFELFHQLGATAEHVDELLPHLVASIQPVQCSKRIPSTPGPPRGADWNAVIACTGSMIWLSSRSARRQIELDLLFRVLLDLRVAPEHFD